MTSGLPMAGHLVAEMRQFVEEEVRYAEDVLASRSLSGYERRRWEIARKGRLGQLIAFQLLTFDEVKPEERRWMRDEARGCHCRQPHHLPVWYCPVHGEVVVPMD